MDMNEVFEKLWTLFDGLRADESKDQLEVFRAGTELAKTQTSWAADLVIRMDGD